MIRICVPPLALALLLVTTTFTSPPPLEATGPAPIGGWTTLFDGTSVEAWRGFKKDAFPAKGWTVEDGWLRVEKGGGGGDIVTRALYQDFDLSFEWKCAPGANSGVMFGVSERESAPWVAGPEFQILDDGDLAADSDISAGALYALASPRGKKLKPAGEVNHGRIVVAGDRIEHYVNGVQVLSVRWGSEDWKKRVAESKFGAMPPFGTVRNGPICLQDHGDDVWFRNIRIRRLRPEEVSLAGGRDPIRLLDGQGLGAWSHFLRGEGAAMEDTWKVEDGVVICSGTPAGYLKTKEQYTNYLLVVEWRWSPTTKKAGNSGVLLRQIEDDKVWPRCVEAQLMSERAGDFYNIGEFPMRGDPERTKGRHTAHTHSNEYPVGEWNRYDILVSGDRVELHVNGQLLNVATEVLEVPGHICLQSEGTEIHFRTVDLYPIPSAGAGEP
ncbi:MAG: 3-keto-disaccharide hydrolase [Planctomycetota bacterium]|jgi:hypothetical protein